MQSGGGGRDGAILAREHGLIIADVAFVGRALAGDIGGQGHASGPFQQHFHRLGAFEVQRHAAIFVARPGDRGDACAKVDPVAIPHPLGIAQEGLPLAQAQALVQRRADPRFAARAFQLGGNDAGVVEDQDIARAQQARQVAHRQVGKVPCPRHLQQPCGIARAGGAQRDIFRREVEVEQVYAHRSICFV